MAAVSDAVRRLKERWLAAIGLGIFLVIPWDPWFFGFVFLLAILLVEAVVHARFLQDKDRRGVFYGLAVRVRLRRLLRQGCLEEVLGARDVDNLERIAAANLRIAELLAIGGTPLNPHKDLLRNRNLVEAMTLETDRAFASLTPELLGFRPGQSASPPPLELYRDRLDTLVDAFIQSRPGPESVFADPTTPSDSYRQALEDLQTRRRAEAELSEGSQDLHDRS